jgi:hypothetical protein
MTVSRNSILLAIAVSAWVSTIGFCVQLYIETQRLYAQTERLLCRQYFQGKIIYRIDPGAPDPRDDQDPRNKQPTTKQK